MHWIASSEKDQATDTLEKRLWAAADQFRANSGLSAAQYSGGRPPEPRLGLIFLRFAEVRFAKPRAQLESQLTLIKLLLHPAAPSPTVPFETH